MASLYIRATTMFTMSIDMGQENKHYEKSQPSWEGSVYRTLPRAPSSLLGQIKIPWKCPIFCIYVKPGPPLRGDIKEELIVCRTVMTDTDKVSAKRSQINVKEEVMGSYLKQGRMRTRTNVISLSFESKDIRRIGLRNTNQLWSTKRKCL